MEQAGDNIGRHNLGLGIVLLHDIVVELACVAIFSSNDFS